MTRDDLLKLLGGYATGTLTAEEKNLLFTAALDDQELFDALADEQALKETLEDPDCRERLLAAAGQSQVIPMPLKKARPRWIVPLSIAASLIVIASTAAIFLNRPAPTEMAVVRPVETLDSRARVPEQAPAPLPAPAQSVSDAQPRRAPGVKGLKREAPREELLQIEKKVLPAPAAEPSPVTVTAGTAGALGGVVGGVPGGVTGNISVLAPAAPPPSFTQTAVSPDGQIVLRYSVLRRTADGQFLPVDPKTEFMPGDEIRLRVEANQTGTISVAEAGTILFASSIPPAVPVTTSTLPPGAGKPLEISFDRPAPRSAMAFSANKQKGGAARSEAIEAKDQLTVVNPSALRITLPLRFKSQ